MSDDRTDPGGTTGPHDTPPAPAAGSGAVSGAGAPWARKQSDQDEIRHSALVGFMSVPVGRRFPLRRSTVLMAVAFVGLATVLYFNPPASTSAPSGGAVVGGYYVPGATPVSTTTTSTTSTTTTTTPPTAATTTAPAPTTQPSRSSTTTTTAAPAGGTGSGGTGSGGTGPAQTTTTAGTGQLGGTTSSSNSG